MNGRKEISPGVVCIYGSAPEQYQPPSSDTIVDKTYLQLEEVFAYQFSGEEEVEAATSILRRVSRVLNVSDCARAYQELGITDMKQVDAYLQERPSIVEAFSKARKYVVEAMYAWRLGPEDKDRIRIRGEIVAGYTEATTFITDTALDHEDTARAYAAHLRILNGVSQRHAPAPGHMPAPAVLLEQLWRTEGGLRFVSSVNTYTEITDTINSTRETWGLEDARSAREKSMSIHPSSQRKKPTVVKIPSAHDAIAKTDDSEDAALRSARELGRLPEQVRAIPRKPPRYY